MFTRPERPTWRAQWTSPMGIDDFTTTTTTTTTTAAATRRRDDDDGDNDDDAVDDDDGQTHRRRRRSRRESRETTTTTTTTFFGGLLLLLLLGETTTTTRIAVTEPISLPFWTHNFAVAARASSSFCDTASDSPLACGIVSVRRTPLPKGAAGAA